MGVWNTKPFDNDAACDWLAGLAQAADGSFLESTLKAASADRESADLGEAAIAAAAVILASRRDPLGRLPPEAKQWVSERGFVAANALIELAIRVIEQIASRSELRELWAESPSLAKWQKEIQSLLNNLRDALKCPAPARTPKSVSTRLPLPKLIEKINLDEETPLRDRLRRKLEAIADVNADVAGTYFQPPLSLVAAQGLIPEAKRLIERGARVNPELKDPLNGRTPLEEACAHGRSAMAEFLLQQGAQICFARELGVILPSGNLEKKVFTFPGALYRAVESGDVATVEVLVRHGADLRDDKARQERLICHAMFDETLLHRAVSGGSILMIDYLVKNGLALDAEDSAGETPLIHAVTKRRLDLVRRLLELGANPNARDHEGDTPVDLMDDPDSPMTALLRAHGGKSRNER